MLAGADQDHRHRYIRLRQPRGAQSHECAEVLEAVLLTAVFEQRRILPQMPRDDISRQAYDAFHSCKRQRIRFVRHAHDQRLADGQGERQANGESRSLAESRIDEQAAAEFFNLGGHHIHADSAARRLCDVPGGAEARLQDELHCLLIGESCMSIDQTQRDGLLANQFDVDAGAVIRNHDNDFRAVALQTDGDSADLGLAKGSASIRAFDAVHHGIAQHVLQRRNHALQHLPIELRGGALHDQFRALGGVVSRLTHEPRQSLHVALKGNHARAHQAVLQFGDHPRLLSQQILRLARQGLEQTLNTRNVARGFGQGARELLQR